MSKKITITFYNPKELWEMFWDRFFWPRRKQCAEWCEFGRYQMEEEIMSEVLDKVDKVLGFYKSYFCNLKTQYRFDYTNYDVDKYANKYYYAFGTTFYIGINFQM